MLSKFLTCHHLLFILFDSWKDNDLRVAMIGKQVDLSYEYEVCALRCYVLETECIECKITLLWSIVSERKEERLEGIKF